MAWLSFERTGWQCVCFRGFFFFLLGYLPTYLSAGYYVETTRARERERQREIIGYDTIDPYMLKSISRYVMNTL
ncbi:hypothetical protein F4809DRAFT_315446 [Biscogniauxia mediterranea]|nr:hypothetical protein F4809DRAFT_315446 [Biscogniauxia mediterranea]